MGCGCRGRPESFGPRCTEVAKVRAKCRPSLARRFQSLASCRVWPKLACIGRCSHGVAESAPVLGKLGPRLHKLGRNFKHKLGRLHSVQIRPTFARCVACRELGGPTDKGEAQRDSSWTTWDPPNRLNASTICETHRVVQLEALSALFGRSNIGLHLPTELDDGLSR